MTAQFSDTVEYRAKRYAIAGKNGEGLFDPAAHGLKVVGKCSACWRGFLCTYSVESQQLLLDELAVCIDENPPTLLEIRPTPDEGEIQLFDFVYEDMKCPVPYSGGLLLASDFIDD